MFPRQHDRLLKVNKEFSLAIMVLNKDYMDQDMTREQMFSNS